MNGFAVFTGGFFSALKGSHLFAADVFESLGLGWQDIVFHAVNLIILIVALRFLLYKPVKGMIDNHKKKLSDMFEENKKLEKEAAAMKEKYDGLIEDAKKEAVRISTEAAHNAQLKSAETIEQAHAQAKNIIESAKKETEAERERLKNSYRETVGELAVDIAEKVLQREITEKDNNRIIDDCLKEWEEK